MVHGVRQLVRQHVLNECGHLHRSLHDGPRYPTAGFNVTKHAFAKTTMVVTVQVFSGISPTMVLD